MVLAKLFQDANHESIVKQGSFAVFCLFIYLFFHFHEGFMEFTAFVIFKEKVL